MKNVHRFSTPTVVVGALIVVGASFLPWAASGRRERSSYELVAIADRLEILDGSAATAVRTWYLAPLLTGAVLLAAALGLRRVGHACAAVVAAGGTLLALAVRASPLHPRAGTYATMLGAGVVGVGLVLARAGRPRRSDETR